MAEVLLAAVEEVSGRDDELELRFDGRVRRWERVEVYRERSFGGATLTAHRLAQDGQFVESGSRVSRNGIAGWPI